MSSKEPEWQEVLAFLEIRMQAMTLRLQETTCAHDETQQIRGGISALRDVLALGKPAAPAPQSLPEPGLY